MGLGPRMHSDPKRTFVAQAMTSIDGQPTRSARALGGIDAFSAAVPATSSSPRRGGVRHLGSHAVGTRRALGAPVGLLSASPNTVHVR